MSIQSPRLKQWQFSAGIVLPAALLLMTTAASVAAFVFWSASGIDERSLARESALVARAIERQIAEIPYAQESVAIWDDAILHATTQFDKEWLDNNLGVWMGEYYGFDAIAVIAADNRPVYTMLANRSPAPAEVAAFWPAIEPMIGELRQMTLGSAYEDYAAGRAEYPRVLDIKSLNGQPAVVSLMPITTQTGKVVQPKGTEPLHLAIDYLDASFAAKLEENYRIADARFVTTPAPKGESASHPIFDRTGRVAAVFEWTPNRPGVELLSQTGPALAVAFIVAGILVFALVNRLRVSSAALEAERLQARYEASHDPLTGLPNRAQFDTQLSRDLVPKKGRPPVALLLLDLDRFKQVNDTLGHEAGDNLIRAVGQRLRELIGPADVLARLGGDEFAVIHPCREGQAGALALAQSIVDAIAKPFDLPKGEAFVGASIGLALSSKGDHDARELTRKADIALYEAKAKGRNRVTVYHDTMSDQLQDRHTIEAELREALKHDDQLSVAFQPLFSGATGEIAGAEALARWTNPRLGQVAPARFISIAESAGLIEALGEFVLRRACMLSARFPGKRIAVNISPAQLRNPRFPERVFDLLVETAMRPSDLELEITESILIDNEEQVIEALTQFRKAGIRVALDDFGTGYSSLNYLKRYPVDCIKIDRSFVAQLANRGASAAIVQAMVTLAHALHIEVTAEGVETHEQMTILKRMGCNLFQGFLLAPPASADAIEAKFRRAAERRRAHATDVAA